MRNMGEGSRRRNDDAWSERRGGGIVDGALARRRQSGVEVELLFDVQQRDYAQGASAVGRDDCGGTRDASRRGVDELYESGERGVWGHGMERQDVGQDAGSTGSAISSAVDGGDDVRGVALERGEADEC